MKTLLLVFASVFLVGFGCQSVVVDKPVMAASSPDGKVTIELYDKPCINDVSLQLMTMTLATLPFEFGKINEAKWIGHAEGRNYTGCWVEIGIQPDVSEPGIIFTFEDGDVKAFAKRLFMKPAGAVLERFRRERGMVTI